MADLRRLLSHAAVVRRGKVAFADDPRVLLDRSQFGLIDSAFLTTYMLGQFVFGPLGDRFGPRRILLCGLALSVLAAVGSGFSTTLTAFIAFAVLQGSHNRPVGANVQDDELVVFASRARASDWLVVYALHGRVRRSACRSPVDDGSLGSDSFRRECRAAESCRSGRPRFGGRRRVLCVGLGPGLAALAQSAGRRRPAADRRIPRRAGVAAR